MINYQIHVLIVFDLYNRVSSVGPRGINTQPRTSQHDGIDKGRQGKEGTAADQKRTATLSSFGICEYGKRRFGRNGVRFAVELVSRTSCRWGDDE